MVNPYFMRCSGCRQASCAQAQECLGRAAAPNEPTLRDKFAIGALQCSPYGNPESAAKWAYEVADAMMKERSK
jgi:hypothetical protein